jgi:hypothetical protein
LRPFDVVALNPYRSNPLPPLAEQPGSGIMPIMTMTLPDGEPEAGHWRIEPISAVVRLLTEAAGSRASRTRVIAVDGRSSSGKTTLAVRLAASIENSHVVHTDDLAWHHSIFGWVDLLTDGILERVRRGVAVSFRPPAWEARDRPGAIEVPAGISTLIVEGVGVGRRELADVVDASVWVQSDLATMDQRNLIRVGNGELPMSVHRRGWPRSFRSWQRIGPGNAQA